jgi:hypothetical protein
LIKINSFSPPGLLPKTRERCSEEREESMRRNEYADTSGSFKRRIVFCLLKTLVGGTVNLKRVCWKEW